MDNQWVKTSDKLPEPFDVVLCVNEWKDVFVLEYIPGDTVVDNGESHWRGYNCHTYDVNYITRWHPLPPDE